MKTESKLVDYGSAIRMGFEYLLQNYPEVFVIGQGLWSPWYVGNSMTDLDKRFGKSRIIDTPVSENACTGCAVGASLIGMLPVVVHPRMDFLLYAIDPIVNQAAKWRHMFGGQANAPVTFRAIINRGGEQGAQHSQALHSWFAHIPGLRVVMPSRAIDARDMLIASVLCPDPVLYIDDRWLYDDSSILTPPLIKDLSDYGPIVLNNGSDVTVVASGYATKLAKDVIASSDELLQLVELIDVRVLNPFDSTRIVNSVRKTGRLVVIDGSWSNCGFAGEVIASVCEKIELDKFLASPMRITLPPSPAPCASNLEKIYYPDVNSVRAKLFSILELGN